MSSEEEDEVIVSPIGQSMANRWGFMLGDINDQADLLDFVSTGVVTNDTVNLAIDDSPNTTRDSLGLAVTSDVAFADITASGVVTGSNLGGTNTGDETNTTINTAIATDAPATITSLGLGTAATTAATDYATAAQGALADTAIQAVTNANVNAAIATDAPATRAALGVSLPLVRKLAIMGDSISSTWGYLQNADPSLSGWTSTALAKIGRGMELVPSSSGFNFQTSGATLTQIRDTWLAEIIASDAEAVILHGGTNGTGAGESAQEKFDIYEEIIDAVYAAGKIPICTTILPVDAPDPTGMNELRADTNELIREYARQNNFLLCDWSVVMVDTATGDANNDFFIDESGTFVHPSITGGHVLGNELAKTLETITQPMAMPDLKSGKWITDNPFMSGDTSGVADDLAISNEGSGTHTPTKLVRTDGYPGEWQKIVIAGAGAGVDGVKLQIAFTGIVTGDQLMAFFEIELDEGHSIYSLGTRALIGDGGGAHQYMYGPYVGGSTQLNALSAFLPQPTKIPGRRVIYTTPVQTVGDDPTSGFAQAYIYGLGTVRIGCLGILKVN